MTPLTPSSRALRALRRALAATALTALVALPAPLLAQDTATLLANAIRTNGAGQLVAEGAVEILYRDRRLQAARVVYDRTGDRISLTGPITLTQGDSVLILADEAELDSELRDGLLRSARLVLDRQMQVAAREIRRSEARYTEATDTVASSCEVCAANPVPLWQIRAKTVRHDQEERQLYFRNARLEIAGVPVLYTPYLRLPDPTLQRATGFLVPSLRTTSNIGTGIALPYFVVLGDRADLTFTPSVTTGGSNTLFLTYRHAFASGELQFDGGVTDDRLRAGLRGYGRLQGRFDMPRDFELTFDLEDVSDGGYYRDYGLPEADRIDSEIALTRIRRDQLDEARLTYFTSFRPGENNDTLPRLLGTVETLRRFTLPGLGGAAELRFAVEGYGRKSQTDVIGRDVGRASADFDWRRSWTTGSGIVGTVMLGASADYVAIAQDSTAPGSSTRAVPRAAIELRWPWARRDGRTSQLIEPIAQLIWSGTDPRATPNEDSVLTEFDEANLFDLNRFTGRDRVEQGARANIGLRYARTSASGWDMGFTIGRVISDLPNPDFAPSSGLDTRLSDWLASVRLDMPNGLSLVQRAQFENSLTVNKAALRLGWQTDSLDLASTYTWLRADATVGRPNETSELALTSSYTFPSDWTASFDWQYDLTADSTRAAGIGFAYRTECITVDLSLSRRFTSSANVQATTDFGLVVSLDGIGNRPASRSARRSCNG